MSEINLNEEWKPVAGYEEIYSVSSLGRVRREIGGLGAVVGRILKCGTMKAGYKFAILGCGIRSKRKCFMIHRLVATAFIGECPSGCVTNHKNGIKGDNRVENLEWITQKENLLHARHVLGKPVLVENLPGLRGDSHPCAKLRSGDVKEIRAMYATGEYRQIDIAKLFGVSIMAISDIINRKRWTCVA